MSANTEPSPETSSASTLVASGFGDDTGGGIFAVKGGGQPQVDRLSTMGLAVRPDGRMFIRVLLSDDQPDSPGEVLLYDERGVHTYRRIDELQEGHAAIWHGDLIVVASTLANSILWLDEAGTVVRKWSAPGEGDCWHVNGLALSGGRLVASAFGRFERHRGWAEPGARDGAGILFDVESGEDILSGLTTPHDPLALDDDWLVCNSAAGELVRFDSRGQVVNRASLGAWTRGLTYDDEHVYVGLSANRYEGGRQEETASVAVLDRRDLRELERLPLPCREVFSLAFVPDTLMRGVEQGFRTNRLRVAEQDRYALLGAGAEGKPTLWQPTEPLSEEDCRVAVEAECEDGPLTASQALVVSYRLANLGGASLSSAPPYPVHIGARWFEDGSGELVDDGFRTRLLAPLEPGATANGTVRMLAPSKPGRYRLVVGAVQEGVRWFHRVDPASVWVGIMDVLPDQRHRSRLPRTLAALGRRLRVGAEEPDQLALLGAGGSAEESIWQATEPLEESDCRVTLRVDFAKRSMRPGDVAMARYELVNEGGASLASAPPYPVHVGVRWFDERSGELVDDGGRARLLTPVQPGESRSGTVRLVAPERPGRYRIVVSVVQEAVRWFDWNDAASAWSWVLDVRPLRRRDPRRLLLRRGSARSGDVREAPASPS